MYAHLERKRRPREKKPADLHCRNKRQEQAGLAEVPMRCTVRSEARETERERLLKSPLLCSVRKAHCPKAALLASGRGKTS